MGTLKGSLFGGLLADFTVAMKGDSNSSEKKSLVQQARSMLTDGDADHDKKETRNSTAKSLEQVHHSQNSIEQHLTILQGKLSNLTLKLEQKELSETYHQHQAIRYAQMGGMGDHTHTLSTIPASERRRMFK